MPSTTAACSTVNVNRVSSTLASLGEREQLRFPPTPPCVGHASSRRLLHDVNAVGCGMVTETDTAYRGGRKALYAGSIRAAASQL